MSTGSVIKGSAALAAGRVAGMACGFLLFLLLTWRSKETAGVFRIAMTYFAVLDLLPLMGMHRWVATEIAHRRDQQYALFHTSCAFAVTVAAICGAVYLYIAYCGAYGIVASRCLELVALASIASAINLCVQAALVGLGRTHQAGLLSLVETIARSVTALPVVLLGLDVSWVIFVFLVTRCATGAVGYLLVRSHVRQTSRRIDRSLVRAFLGQTPNLALSTVGFLVHRNAAVALLPLFRDAAAAGLYAAPFQLYDLVLMAPTVLTISTNYVFAESSRKSAATLRQRTNQLVGLTATYVLPVALLGIVLAAPIIATLFGRAFDEAAPALQILLLSAIVISLDQILALCMAVSGRYSADRICMLVCASVTVAATCLLSGPFSATGAAAAYLVGSCCALLLRFSLLGGLLRVKPLAAAIRRQSVAAIAAGLTVWLIMEAVARGGRVSTPFGILLGGVGLAVYGLVLYWRGAFEPRELQRIKGFMSTRSLTSADRNSGG